MRRLPFPTDAVLAQEPASNVGTPASNVDDIPIDPALAAAAIDPALVQDASLHPLPPQQVSILLEHVHAPLAVADASRVELALPPPQHSSRHQQLHPIIPQDQFSAPLQRHYSQEPLKYDQGPQGDPFAPQPPAAYLPIPETELPRVTKPQKRKRRPRRERECGFCQGNDSKNKHDEPERMVSCEDCGRSGHPSCMNLAKHVDIVRSYPWRCTECKICEICHEKGDDARILLCDFCDRGWHMDCLQPPLDEEPPGQWHCPLCPPLQTLLPEPHSTQAPHDALPPEGLDTPTDRGQAIDPSGAAHEMGIQANDSSSDESSDSDSDSNETVSAAPARRPQSIKKRSAKCATETQTPRPAKRMRIKVRSPPPPLIVRLRLPPKGKGKEREDDMEHNIFEDILSPSERDMSRTTIDNSDRTKFDKSRLAAEEKLYPAPAPPPISAGNPDTPIAGPSSRPLRSATLHQLSIPHLSPASPVPSTPSFVPPTPATFSQTPNTPTIPDGQSALRIRTIRFGPYDIHPWYDAPFPEEYASIPDGRLWICEFCLKYMRSRFAFSRHRLKCKARHPPGDEIYRDGTISIFEVDGRKNKIYCQNLCLLSKMFLDHKSLFYDVEPFLFYVMTETDDIGAHFLGYFSKEKCSPKQYNVSCIMTLPVRQRQGWGNYLIDFSYLLSKKEQRAGSPEKPLSALGALGYKNYWTLALMRYLVSAPPKPTLEDISRATSLTIEDISTILMQQDMIVIDTTSPNLARPCPGQSIKFPRGRKNGIARRHLQRPNPQKQAEGGGNKPSGPFVPPAHYEICWDQEKVEHWLRAWEKKGNLRLKPEKLKWAPFVLSHTKGGAEVLQTEARLGFDILTRTSTPQSPMDGGTPILDVGDRANSLGARRSSSNEQVAITRDTGEVTAAHLFDDLLQGTTTPRRRLRSNFRDPSLDPLAMSPRTGSAPQVAAGNSGLRGESSDSLPDGTSVAQDSGDVTSSTPSKRRRSRLPRARSLEKTPDLPQVSSTEPGPTLPPKPASPRKRRKLNPPSPEDLSAPMPTFSEQRDDCAGRSHAHHPFVVNGEGHGTNGVHPVAPQDSSGASLAVDTMGGDRGQGVLPDVKSEDVGTPLTGLTSRHSVPSDDTVFVAEGVNGAAARSKISGDGEGVPQVLASHGTEDGGPTEELRVEVEEDSDLDAEGEPDDEI